MSNAVETTERRDFRVFRLHLVLNRREDAELKAVADQLNVKKSQFVRQAVAREIERQQVAGRVALAMVG